MRLRGPWYHGAGASRLCVQVCGVERGRGEEEKTGIEALSAGLLQCGELERRQEVSWHVGGRAVERMFE